jgi:hypothetical protein
MKTSVLKKLARSTEQTRTQNGENYWALHEAPSDFDEAAFQHVRRNFQRLVHYFNELADLTGQDRLQVESNPPPATVTSIVASIESENNRL